MTDCEKLKSLLEDFEIGYSEMKGSDCFGAMNAHRFNNTVIHIHEGYSNVEGWGGFYTNFEFTPEGSFVSMGIWE